MLHTYVEVLFSLKKEGYSDMCYKTDETQLHHAKWDKAVTKRQIPYESTSLRYLEVVKFKEIGSRMVVSRAGNSGEEGLVYITMCWCI